MDKKILVPDEAYRVLRQDSRELLGQLGVGSNPCFTDHDILTRLSEGLGLEAPEAYDENNMYSGEMFRDSLALILGLELPASIVEVRVDIHERLQLQFKTNTI